MGDFYDLGAILVRAVDIYSFGDLGIFLRLVRKSSRDDKNCLFLMDFVSLAWWRWNTISKS